MSESFPESVLFLINNYKVSLIFSRKICSFYSDTFKEALDSKNNEYAQKCLSALTKFQESIEANPNLSLSNDFRVSFKALASLIRKPEKHNIYSHLFLAMTGKVDFYIASKPLLSKTKKFYNEIASIQDNDHSNLLHISTFQEIFETYIGLELRDIAYDSKKFDFYIADEGGSEWDKIEHIAPQNIGAEYFGFKEKKDLMKKNKTLKFYRLTKFGKRRAKKRRINKSLLENIDNLPHNYLEPFPNIEPSYIEFSKFDQVTWLFQRIVDLEVQVKPLIFLDSSLIFQFLLNFEANGKKFPSEFTEQISNQFEFVCLPGVLFDLEEAGYTEFVREFLKEIINLPKLLEIEKFIVNYQNKLDEYGFNNLNIGILSDSVYWNFYVQFHVCIARFLNADTILIVSNLKKHYLNKNCYNGKFSFFVEPKIKPTSLKCITAKKFWKKFKLEKQKAESENLKDFVVSSNFKEWEVPECLGKILKELDRKLIKDVNTFWLDIFRISENQVENKKYFEEFVELINKFEDNAKILKAVPQFSSLIDKNMHSRSNFSDIKDYARKIKKFFQYLLEINRNRGFINSNELFLTVLLFKSNVSNFLRDRFYLKAKFKSPALPTIINFDLFFKDGNIQQELSSIIPTRYRSNTLQKIIVKNKGTNKSSIRFEPNLQNNDEFINQLFRKFLFTNYCFHKNELETVYRDFIRFIKTKKEYRAIAKGFSFNRFEGLILDTQERSLILLEPHGIYYSKLLENFLLLIHTYHRIHENSISLELSAKILNIKKNELETLIYFLIHNGNMFRSAKHPKYSLLLQAVKELNDKSTKLSQAKTYTPYWFPKRNRKVLLSHPELWVESESDTLNNTPIYYVDKENRVSYSDKAFNIEIKGETFGADVDTGAFKSLMSKNIAERLFPKQKRYRVYVSGYTQHTKSVAMIKDVMFAYNGQNFTDDFLIEENLKKIFGANVVIGRDGYNKMLVRYYGKTLDNLFNKENSQIYEPLVEKRQIIGIIADLKKDVSKHITIIIDNLEISEEQKDKVRIKASGVLDDFILRVENDKVNIHFNTRDKTFAASIVYSVIISDKTLINIGYLNLSKIAGVNRHSIREIYDKHFRSFHPRSEFLFSAYRFSNINKVVSLYIFNQIRDNDIPTNELLSQIKKLILDAQHTKIFQEEDIKTLKEMIFQYQNTFTKYFTDLIETVKLITFSSRSHRIIKASIVIIHLVRYLEERDINLLQQTETFYKIVREIFDHLSISNTKFFPERLSRAFENRMSKREYRLYLNKHRQVVGYRLKLYLLKNLSKNNIRCPECEKEGFEINTGINRLNALEFHHQTEKKSEIFNAVRLYEIFTKNQANPYFLEKIREFLELEKVTILCRNHHMMIDDYYFQYFKHFINFDKLFSFRPEEIHLFLRVAVDNFRLTKNLSSERKSAIRYRITSRIKKKYIIEKLYGKKCITCGEFNTEKHLRGFNFCHQDPSLKTVQASTLFHNHSLQEIVEILRNEKGAYLCSNCHTVYDMEYYDVIDEIYDSKEVSKRIKDDYLNVRKKFKPISEMMVRNIKDPLMKTIRIREGLIKYIMIIHEFNKTNVDATNETLSNHLCVDYSGVKSFFFKRRDFLKHYVNFSYGRPNKYSLTDKGRNLVELINYFKQYYRSFKLEECNECELDSKDGCLAKRFDECPLIKLGNHLHFIPEDV